MKQALLPHLENLKAALLKLNATGEKGFEGLIGVALREVTGLPFRLAKSGSQRGLDGRVEGNENSVYFEGKRYSGPIPRSEIITKIADLGRTNRDADFVWILGATVRVSTQDSDDLSADGHGHGITVLILDWSEVQLPKLALALAMGKTAVEDFLKDTLKKEQLLHDKVIEALGAIRSTPDFVAQANQLKASLNAPGVAISRAKEANIAWLDETFSDQKLARARFGQPLSPTEPAAAKLLDRSTLTERLRSHLTQSAEDGIVFVLGEEGCGKSWVVAQSWLALTQKPLMLFMNAEAVHEPIDPGTVEKLLIKKLIEQTGDIAGDRNAKRWERRLMYWRNTPASNRLPLVVLLDGINQRPNTDWGRLIESMSCVLNELGGRLIVTCRASYYHERVKRRLVAQRVDLTVPEWTHGERDEILRARGISPSTLSRSVTRSLRNPRLLGIALELFEDMSSFQELSISRLLFEYIYASERHSVSVQPATEFVRRLRDHAKQILDRVRENREEDPGVFEGETLAVADGRFFRELLGEHGRYELCKDGLTLALGFAVVDCLRIARRQRKDLSEVLTTLLEPIAALDDTADVVLAALTIVIADDDQPDHSELAATLLKGFASLQNPDNSKFKTLRGLAKTKPSPFLQALRALSLAGGHQPNFDWLQAALSVAARQELCWTTISAELQCWLSTYSPSSDASRLAYGLDPAQVRTEAEKKSQEIQEKIRSLSRREDDILRNLTPEAGDISTLWRAALILLAGKPLAPLAGSLLHWSFANALSAERMSPDKEFAHLISLNRVDWAETRAELLRLSDPLRASGIARTGKWALVAILRATGDPKDAKEAEEIAATLMGDRQWPQSWRQIENYCKTDPCDPNASEPENISKTSGEFAAIDTPTLHQTMGVSLTDHFFTDARLGMVRFRLDGAVAKHREFVEEVVTRGGFRLRQGVLQLEAHTPILTRGHAQALISKWRLLSTNGELAGLSISDAWIVRQYHLLLAFPFLSAEEQVQVLLEMESAENILLELMDVTRPLEQSSFERFLESATNDYQRYLLLEIAIHTDTPISSKVRDQIVLLLRSDDGRLRTAALGIAAKTADATLLTALVDAGWDATSLDRNDRFEAWYGSAALLDAAKLGLIDAPVAVARISPDLYGKAIKTLGSHAIPEVARRLDVAIDCAVGLDHLVAPEIEIDATESNVKRPSHIRISEKISPSESLAESLQRISTSPADFEHRQKRNYSAYAEFCEKLNKANAAIILDNLGLDAFTAIVSHDGALSEKWRSLFMDLPAEKLPTVHNLILFLAHAMSDSAPDMAKDLFQRAEKVDPLVRITFGKAGVDLKSIAVWAGKNTHVLNQQRFLRLDQASTDYELSKEVLAALLSGKQELLITYIQEKVADSRPALIARGIMVAGFSDKHDLCADIITRYEKANGLLGQAQTAAKYAYDRNSWAREWYQRMSETDDPIEFWRCKLLFSKIVDGRFQVWRDEYARSGLAIQQFSHTIQRRLRHRFNRWVNHRKKKLFGRDAPPSIFLQVTKDWYFS